MKFGSRQYFQYLEKIQERQSPSEDRIVRSSCVEVGGALGLIRVTFKSKLSPRLRRAMVRGFFRHNKKWLRYFRSIALTHDEKLSVDPQRAYERGLPLFETRDLEHTSGRLGFKIQLLRLKLGLTQAKLARLTGIAQSYISQIERGIVCVRADTRLRILAALEIRRGLTEEDYLLCE